MYHGNFIPLTDSPNHAWRTRSCLDRHRWTWLGECVGGLVFNDEHDVGLIKRANNAPVQLQGFNLHTTSKHWLVQKIWRSSNRSTFIEIDDRFVGCFQGWTGIPSNQTSWCYILTIQHNLERRRTFCWKVITISDFDGFSWGHDCCDITVTSIQHE